MYMGFLTINLSITYSTCDNNLTMILMSASPNFCTWLLAACCPTN